MKTDAIRVAVVQAAPVFFDRDATVAKLGAADRGGGEQ